MARGDRRAFNVGELIEELQKYPKDMIVAKAPYLPIWGVKTDRCWLDHRDLGEDCDREVDVVIVW